MKNKWPFYGLDRNKSKKEMRKQYFRNKDSKITKNNNPENPENPPTDPPPEQEAMLFYPLGSKKKGSAAGPSRR